MAQRSNAERIDDNREEQRRKQEKVFEPLRREIALSPDKNKSKKLADAARDTVKQEMAELDLTKSKSAMAIHLSQLRRGALPIDKKDEVIQTISNRVCMQIKRKDFLEIEKEIKKHRGAMTLDAKDPLFQAEQNLLRDINLFMQSDEKNREQILKYFLYLSGRAILFCKAT